MLLGPEILSGIQDDLDVIQSGGDKYTWRWKTGVEFMEYSVQRPIAESLGYANLQGWM